MVSKKTKTKKKKSKTVGIEAIVEPGVGALYVRRAWMKKPKIDKKKSKLLKKKIKKKL